MNFWVTAIFALIGLLASGPSASAQGSWTAEANIPTPRALASGDVIGGDLFVVGGNGGGGITTGANEAYDLATNTWTENTPDPVVRSQAQAAAANGLLYVIGGCINSDCIPGVTGLNEVYDPTSNTWTLKAPDPLPVHAAAIGAINGKIYVAGGMAQCGPCIPLDTLEIYDTSTDLWTAGPTMPVAVDGAASAVINGVLYVFGGNHGSDLTTPTAQFVSTVQAYDPVTNSWSLKSDMPTARTVAAAAAVNGVAYVMGGYALSGTTPTGTNVNEAYDAATDMWSTATPLPQTSRQFAVAGSISGAAVVASGWNANAGDALVAETDAFTPAPRFAGTPGQSNCYGQSVAALAQQYGGLDAAAAQLGYAGVSALQNAIGKYCGA